MPTLSPLLRAVSGAFAPVVTIYGSAASAATVTFTLAVLVLPTLSVKRIDNCPDVCLKGMLTKVENAPPGDAARLAASKNFSFDTESVKKISLSEA